MRLCSIDGCEKKHKAKGLCNSHYVSKHHRNIRHICENIGCDNTTNGFDLCCNCKQYLTKKNKHIHGNCGSNNARWRGGNSDYKNHSIFKQNRIIILKQYNFKCGKCNNKATQVHHKDYSKDNHDISNLLPLCSKCHGNLHTFESVKLYHINKKVL